MAAAWRVAGLNYIKYSQIAARCVSRVILPTNRDHFRFAGWLIYGTFVLVIGKVSAKGTIQSGSRETGRFVG